jgi:TolA-binding protein
MDTCLNQDTQDSRIYRIETVRARIASMEGKVNHLTGREPRPYR